MNSIPMVIKCCLGQGCNRYPLDMVDAATNAQWEARMEASLTAALLSEPVTHSTLATWALNLPVSVVKDLAEPTRKDFQP